MQEQYPEQLENIIKENSIVANSIIAVFLWFIRHNAFDRAKKLISIWKNISLKSNTYDFFGYEGVNLLIHLKFLVSITTTSECSIRQKCPEAIQTNKRADFPVMSNVCGRQDEFASIIKTWRSGALVSPCLTELNPDAPEDIVECIPRKQVKFLFS